MEEALKEVMKHAVAGHSSDSSYHHFCNNPDHAAHILAENGFRVRPLLGGAPGATELMVADDEGMTLLETRSETFA